MNIGPKERKDFIITPCHIKTYKISNKNKCLALGFISNVLEDHIIQGEMLG
jgi:hypothetical protein